MADDVLKISGTNGGDIYFDEKEVRDVVVEASAESIIQESQVQPPHIMSNVMGTANSPDEYQYKIITIYIYHKNQSTVDKLDEIFEKSDKRELKTIYYKYYLDNSVSESNMAMIPTRREIYNFGEYGTDVLTILKFYPGQDYYRTSLDKTPVYGMINFIRVTITDGIETRILDGFNDVKNIMPITMTTELNPASLGTFILYDAQILFNDSNEFLNIVSRDSANPLFTYAWQKSYSGNILGGYASRLEPEEFGYTNASPRFREGQVVKVYGASTNTKKQISNIVINQDGAAGFPGFSLKRYRQKLIFEDGDTINTNDIVFGDSLYGAEISIDWKRGEYDTNGNFSINPLYNKTLYKGIMRGFFSWNENQASLSIDNFFSKKLQKLLTVYSDMTDPQICNDSGSLTSAVSSSTASGTTDATKLTIYAGAIPGDWEVTFTDATNFTVTGVGIKDKAGDTSTDFYDGTDATDSQVKIDSSFWGGTWAADETVSFTVAVNIDDKKVGAAMYDLLTDNAGIDSDDVDTTSYNATDKYSNKITLSFATQVTVGEAVARLGVHNYINLVQRNEKIAFFCFHPYSYAGTSKTYNPGCGRRPPYDTDNNILPKNQKISVSDFYNEITVKYGWDYTNGAYQYSYTYPENDSSNYSYQILGEKHAVTIEMPGYYSDSVAETWAKRIWELWAFGMVRVTLQSEIMEVEVGDIARAARRYSAFGGPVINNDDELITFVVDTVKHNPLGLSQEISGYVLPHDQFGNWF